MKVLLAAGARPNFMKVAPLLREARHRAGLECKLVNTGQHYDYEMSQSFFDYLNIDPPHYRIESGSGSQAEQTARIMIGFEKICIDYRPDIVMVVGDVNSTLACSITAKKLCIEVAHVEAGLRSFDRTMPEEINRIVTDSISDYLFVTEKSAEQHLIREGAPLKRIIFTGDVMVDNLLYQKELLTKEMCEGFDSHHLKKSLNKYAFLTLHRPSNVDNRQIFTNIMSALNDISKTLPIIFPVHPRTRKMIKRFRIKCSQHIHILPPLNFMESLYLWKDAAVVMTDSGGLQGETTVLGVPCITLRENTERPVTIELGTNNLVGVKAENIIRAFKKAIGGEKIPYRIPPGWDGKASIRIWDALLAEK